jgi:hypothetical protein
MRLGGIKFCETFRETALAFMKTIRHLWDCNAQTHG